jgi:dGTPase
MFERVYRNPVAKGQESKAKDLLQKLFEYYYANPDQLPEDFQPQMSFDGLERTVCDYIAGMTDHYAVDKYTEIFIPAGWHVRG